MAIQAQINTSVRATLFGAALLVLICPSLAAAADWRLHDALAAPPMLKLSGSIRARYEAVAGQPRAGFPGREDAVNFRSNLFAEYTAGAVRIGGELYDSRVYGAKPGSAIGNNEVNAFEPVQAYVAVDFKDALGPRSKASVQAGRFLLDLGSRRLAAAEDFRNTLTGFTGVRADFSGNAGGSATVFAVAPQTRLPDDQPSVLDNEVRLDRESKNLLLWGGIGARRGPWDRSIVEASYFGLKERDAPGRPTRNRDLATFSGRLVRNPAPNRYDYEVEVIHQIGSVRANLLPSASTLDVSANFLHLRLGRQFADPWKTRIAVEYDFASGDRGGGAYNRFDTLYGMRRGDFAPAGLYSAMSRANLISPGLRLEIAPTPRWDAFATARAFWLASATDNFSGSGVRDPSGRSGRYAGFQLDGRARYWLVPNVLRFEGDAVWLSKGRFLETAPNRTRGGDTRYVSLNLTWSF